MVVFLFCSATGGGRVGGVDGRVLGILERTGAVVTTPPEYYPVPDVVRTFSLAIHVRASQIAIKVGIVIAEICSIATVHTFECRIL